jgi:hypothetical protein
VFYLHHNPNDNNICKLWWQQYNKTNEFSSSYQQEHRKGSGADALIIHHILEDEPPLQFYYQSVHFCLIKYFLLRIYAVNFTNSRNSFNVN